MALKLRIGDLFGRKAKKRAPTPEVVAGPLTDLFAQEPVERSTKSKSALPRFKATAADQVDRHAADRFTSMRMKLRAAFTPSQPVVDRRMFAGRSGVLANMIGAIEDQKLHLVVYGQRGIGKTSLMHMLTEAAREARYLVHYSSCGAASNFQETFRAAANEIPLLFHTGFGPTAEEAEGGATLGDLLPKGAFSPRQFGDLCAKLTGTRVLIILDEFDRCESVEFRRDLAELIKILSDRSVRVQLIIAGVAADIADLVEHIPSIRRNILAVRVPLLTEAEARELVATGERASGLVFDPTARDFVVRIALGWPYIASLICHHAGLSAIDASRSTVLVDDVSAALEESMSELASRIAKPALLQVDRFMEEGAGKLLHLVAGAALRSGGEFEKGDVEAVASKPSDAVAAMRFIGQVSADKVLIQTREDGQRTQYSFIEDGLPAYLWFQGAQQEFISERKPRASNG